MCRVLLQNSSIYRDQNQLDSYIFFLKGPRAGILRLALLSYWILSVLYCSEHIVTFRKLGLADGKIVRPYPHGSVRKPISTTGWYHRYFSFI